MKYVCDVCGWEYDEEAGYPDGGIAPEQNGKIFPMILSAPSAAWARISFPRHNRQRRKVPLR